MTDVQKIDFLCQYTSTNMDYGLFEKNTTNSNAASNHNAIDEGQKVTC